MDKHIIGVGDHNNLRKSFWQVLADESKDKLPQHNLSTLNKRNGNVFERCFTSYRKSKHSNTYWNLKVHSHYSLLSLQCFSKPLDWPVALIFFFCLLLFYQLFVPICKHNIGFCIPVWLCPARVLSVFHQCIYFSRQGKIKKEDSPSKWIE